jgi:hypothetical protein
MDSESNLTAADVYCDTSAVFGSVDINQSRSG